MITGYSIDGAIGSSGGGWVRKLSVVCLHNNAIVARGILVTILHCGTPEPHLSAIYIVSSAGASLFFVLYPSWSRYDLVGDILWRHDGYRGIQKQYPIKLSQHPAFGSIPRFQAALNWPRNRKNYFFVGYDYYRYTHTQDNSSVLEGPFSSAKAWLGCKDWTVTSMLL